jgi:hypothetical protein
VQRLARRLKPNVFSLEFGMHQLFKPSSAMRYLVICNTNNPPGSVGVKFACNRVRDSHD